MAFNLKSRYSPAGDQVSAIKELVSGVNAGVKEQALLGVTGSGKTFTMANVIAETKRPALILVHNKILASQIYEEMRSFFPEDKVEYFVSYYDYYQPEAYIPTSGIYIEKESVVNEKINLLRHSATRSLIESKNVIIVSSISCIYGIGGPASYGSMTFKTFVGQEISIENFQRKLSKLHYEYAFAELKRGSFRSVGESVYLVPSHLSDIAWVFTFCFDKIESIAQARVNGLTNFGSMDSVTIFANNHYISSDEQIKRAVEQIKIDLANRLKDFEEQNKRTEALRLQDKVSRDIEMLISSGTCNGVENYSKYLCDQKTGDPPPTLYSNYFPRNGIMFVDESHVTVPQVGGMYNGNKIRKENLVEHGFRLPSAMDNRPLNFEEWERFKPNHVIYVSATPGKYEKKMSAGRVVEQVIRPTGLVDPECFVRPARYQVDDAFKESRDATAKKERTMIITLTKKMAEELSIYMKENGMKVTFLHSDVKTLDRVEIINSLRAGKIDVLIGVNLLREGIDVPECGLVLLLDCDKEGFLRSETSIIQIIGRAARNKNGRVILYADKITESMSAAISETSRRRKKQQEYNLLHGIEPETVVKPISWAIKNAIEEMMSVDANNKNSVEDLKHSIEVTKKAMISAADALDFELAISLRDKLRELELSK